MKVKHWIKIGVFCILAVLILLFASELLCVANEKDSVGVYGFFLEPEDSVDVVLVGSSAIYSAFYSPLAYEEQGFTSYALSTSTMRGSLYKYAAQLAIEKQHPQLLVFETYSFCYEDQQDETSLRKFLDALPNSSIKQQAIDEVVPDELKRSFRRPFEKYHSSWVNLGECIQVLQDKWSMKRRGYSVTKNYATILQSINYRRSEDTYQVSDAGFEALEDLLEYLKEADIENVLFVRTPEMIHYENTESYSRMIEMIRDAGFDFVNLNGAIEDIGIDMNHDFYNTTHLNIFGAEKFTSFLSDYIMKRYQLDTTHTAEVTNEWDTCAAYNEKIIPDLKEMAENNVLGFLYLQKDFGIQ